MKSRRLAANLALAALSLAVVVVVAEQVLRAVDYEPSPLRIKIGKRNEDWRLFHAFEDRHFEYDPELFWRPRRGFDGFNDQGYLGPELSRAKTGAEYRIFAIGDSNTLGWLGGGASWPAYLGQLLRDRDGSFSVTNAGVYGYSSYQGLIRFRKSLAFEPDLVLIGFGSNDAHQVPVNDLKFGMAEIARCTWAQSLARYRLGLLLASACRGIAAQRSGEAQARVSLDDYRSNLTEIVRLARQRKIAVVLLTRPYTGRLRTKVRWKSFAHQYNAVSVEVAVEHDVPLVDLYSHFKGRDELFADESHFNARGHERAAEIVLETLEPLLPGPVPEEIFG